MGDNTIIVYAKVNGNNIIIDVNSSIFIDNVTGWAQIEEGTGDKFSHAQSNYLDKGLIDDNGNYNYKLTDGKVTELTDTEKETLFPTSTSVPSKSDRIKALESAIATLMGV